MEIDYRTVKALSSPTRIEILNGLLDKESTPTRISDNLERSKSTVSEHLSVLHRAGLVEKDAREGRKRVIYRPTDKARSIIKGRERKVRFSLAGSALSALLGTASLGYLFMERFLAGGRARADTAFQSGGNLQAESLAPAVAESARSSLLSVPDAGTILLVVGVASFGAALSLLLYGYTLDALEVKG